MNPDVNPQPVAGRPSRVARTEEKLVAAASGLFIANGYAATTMEAVALAAEVSPRTVYVRFGTKTALLKRVVDAAIVGDLQPVDVLGRDWTVEGFGAPTRQRRIAAVVHMNRQIMERTGDLFAVALQAAATEPEIEGFWEEGRAGSLRVQQMFWTKAREDGLLSTSVDLDWLIETCTVLGSAQSYLLGRTMFAWTPEQYEAQLLESFIRLSSGR